MDFEYVTLFVVVTKHWRSGELDGEVHSRSRSYFFIQTRSMGPIMIFNRQIVRRGTLDGSLMALCGVTDTEFPDLADPQTRDHACTHRIIGALLMPVFV